MTCQHCQTWILDDEHRCARCGRRVRATPSRISPATYPIAATATAHAYDFEEVVAASAKESVEYSAAPAEVKQQALFAGAATDTRVIPFSSLVSSADRDAMRVRAAEVERPSPVKTARVESKRVRAKRKETGDQHLLAFGSQGVPLPGTRAQICDAPVATAAVRVHAALVDALIIALGCSLGIGMFLYVGGRVSSDKHLLPFAAAALFTVPLLYKLLWAFAGQDSFGTKLVGLELVDFDGRPPTKARRFQRLFSSCLSILAAGVGMVWALVDEDKLTWHDHMSGTFPTFSSEI